MIEVQCVQWIVLFFNKIQIAQLMKCLSKQTNKKKRKLFSRQKLNETVLKVMSCENEVT